MVRPSDYVNAEYDRKLAEYKALKAKLKQEGSMNSNNSNSNKPSNANANSSFRQESRFR